MRVLVKFKGREGMIVGYAPGKKGNPVAVVVIDAKLHAIKLRQLEVVGYAKFRGELRARISPDLMDWNPSPQAPN